MEHSTSILSDRTQRYGRNCLIIGVVASVVHFGAANFDGAGLFGIKVEERVFWIVVLIFSVWNAGFFAWLVWDDVKGWKRGLLKNAEKENLPNTLVKSAPYVTGLRPIPREVVQLKGATYKLDSDSQKSYSYVYNRQSKGDRHKIGKTSLRLERNKFLRLYSIDGLIPFSVVALAGGIAIYNLLTLAEAIWICAPA